MHHVDTTTIYQQGLILQLPICPAALMEVLASVILYVQIGSKQNTLNMYATSSQLLLLDSRTGRKVSVTAMDSTCVIALGPWHGVLFPVR